MIRSGLSDSSSTDADAAVAHALAGCVTPTVCEGDGHSDLWHSQSFKSLRKRQAKADEAMAEAHGEALRAEAQEQESLASFQGNLWG